MLVRGNRDPEWVNTSKEFPPSKSQSWTSKEFPPSKPQSLISTEFPPLKPQSLTSNEFPPSKPQSWTSKVSDFFSNSTRMESTLGVPTAITGSTIKNAVLASFLFAVVVTLLTIAVHSRGVQYVDNGTIASPVDRKTQPPQNKPPQGKQELINKPQLHTGTDKYPDYYEVIVDNKNIKLYSGSEVGRTYKKDPQNGTKYVSENSEYFYFPDINKLRSSKDNYISDVSWNIPNLDKPYTVPAGWEEVDDPDPQGRWEYIKFNNFLPLQIVLTRDPNAPVLNNGFVGIRVNEENKEGKYQIYIPNQNIDDINELNVKRILQINQQGGAPTSQSIQNLLSQLPPNSPLKNIQIPDLSQKSTAEQIKLVEEFKSKLDPFLPPEFQQLKIPHSELEIPAFLQNIKIALDKYNMTDLFSQFMRGGTSGLFTQSSVSPKIKGGQVEDLTLSTKTARKASTLEEASKVVCAEDEKFKSYLLKSDSTWVCKDAACKEWGIKTADGVKDVDQGILDAQCDAMGLASGCENTLKNCATGDVNNCFDTLVKVGNKFGGYSCGEKKDAIMKVSPGLVRDILMHLGFKTQFSRDVSHGIDLLRFESLPEYIAHSSDALRVRLESSLYNNLTSFLRLMIEWANAHPAMLNDALVKSNVKVTQATPLSMFTLKEKSIIPGTATSDLGRIIGEFSRLGYQQGGMSAQGLSHYFQNISGFTQKLNTNTINDIRMGRTSVQSGGSLTAESVLGTLKYRSTADSAIFSAIIDEVRKMLNTRYNMDLSAKSQQRVQEKLEAFRVAERALFDSMTEALERERVLKATGQQIDIDNVTNDAERRRLIEHYTGMSKLLDDKNKQASKLISAIQSMLKAALER